MMTIQTRSLRWWIRSTIWAPSRRFGQATGLSLALLFAWLAGAAQPATAGDPRSGGYGNGDSDSLEDEVGSLPTVRDDGNQRVDGAQDGSAQALPQDPSLVLIGSASILHALVVDAHGDGSVFIETTPVLGTERWTFRGEPTVVLDRSVLALGLVDVHVEVGLRFAGGAASVQWEGGRTAAQRLPLGGDLDLPVGRLVASGVLDARPATLHLVSPLGAHAGFGLRASADHLAILPRRY